MTRWPLRMALLLALLLAFCGSPLRAGEKAADFSAAQKRFKLAFKRLPLEAPAKLEKRLRPKLPRSIEITSAPFDALVERLMKERVHQLDLRTKAMGGLAAFPSAQAGRLIQTAYKTTGKENADLQKRILEVEAAYGQVYLRGWMDAGTGGRQTRMLAAVVIPFYRRLLAHNAALSATAAEAMAAMKEGPALEWLLRTAGKGKPPALRAAAVGALSIQATPAAEAALRTALRKDPKASVRSAALAGLMRRPLEAVSDAVLGALLDDVWQVRALAIRICVRGRLVPAVGTLIRALEKESGRLRKDIDDALFVLTGARMYADVKLWTRWLSENQETLAGKAAKLEQAGAWRKPLGPVSEWEREEDAATEDEGDREGWAKKGGSSSFYGIPTWSKRILFLVDISRSMDSEAAKQPPAQGDSKDRYARPLTKSKLAIAKWQLHRAIEALSDDATCNILVYSESYKAWRPEMVALKRKAKGKAHAFIDSLRANGTTNISDPLDKAFEVAGAGPLGLPPKATALKADTIFLLSDGEPNRGRSSRLDELLEEVARRNAPHGLVIHAIGIGEVAGSSFLEELALKNGGQYVGFP